MALALDPKLEAASALLLTMGRDPAHLEVERARWAARLMESTGAAPEEQVLPVVARAARVVLALRQQASARDEAGDRESAGRMSAAAIELEQSARVLLMDREPPR